MISFLKVSCKPLESILVSLLIFVVLGDNLLGRVEAKKDCYVCSWSAKDMVNGSTVRDTCTPTNFRPEYVSTISCESGCEAVAFKDTINGELRHFHRNCAIVKADTSVQDRCEETEGKIQFEQRCECFSSLCNTSPKAVDFSALLLHIKFIALAILAITVT